MVSSESSKSEEELSLEDIVKILEDVNPKEYEAKLKEAGIFDFRVILKVTNMMKKRNKEKLEAPVSFVWLVVVDKQALVERELSNKQLISKY